MRPLAPEEKLSTIMVYTHNLFARGQIITNENVRVSIWLRTQGAPNYVTTQAEMRRKAKIGVKNGNADKADTE